jgi:hypothetical protein
MIGNGDKNKQSDRIQVQMSESDAVKCECGVSTFTQVLQLFRKNNPIVGQPPVQVGKPCFQCTGCQKVLPDS